MQLQDLALHQLTATTVATACFDCHHPAQQLAALAVPSAAGASLLLAAMLPSKKECSDAVSCGPAVLVPQKDAVIPT